MVSRAQQSDIFWTRELVSPGLTGSCGLASPILLENSDSKSHESFEEDLDLEDQPGPASPWTHESQLTPLVVRAQFYQTVQ